MLYATIMLPCFVPNNAVPSDSDDMFWMKLKISVAAADADVDVDNPVCREVWYGEYSHQDITCDHFHRGQYVLLQHTCNISGSESNEPPYEHFSVCEVEIFGVG